jgi:hypothetical protein
VPRLIECGECAAISLQSRCHSLVDLRPILDDAALDAVPRASVTMNFVPVLLVAIV